MEGMPARLIMFALCDEADEVTVQKLKPLSSMR